MKRLLYLLSSVIFLLPIIPFTGCDNEKGTKQTGEKGAVKEVALETLLRPANAFVVSSIPVITAAEREEEVELNVVGTVAYDTRQIGAISSRLSGRIERLYLRYRYQPVKKGQRVLDLYSPELVTAQQNLLFLLRNDAANASLISAARDRLLLLGMTPAQVAGIVKSRRPIYSVPVFSNYSGFVIDLTTPTGTSGSSMGATPSATQTLSIREGMYVQSGQTLFSVYNQSSVWVLLNIFPEQQQVIEKGNSVRVVPETAPHKNFRATIDYIEPLFRRGSKTLTARLHFNNAAMQLPVGSRVRATIFAAAKKAVWLPREAVISLGRDKIVFGKEKDGFMARRITTGMEANGHLEVANGLQLTDSVAANAQFLVDNEAFIKVSKQ